VAELVDALVSGISSRKAVGVRVPSWAVGLNGGRCVIFHAGLVFIVRIRPSFPPPSVT
jgi:hypothetical protein